MLNEIGTFIDGGVSLANNPSLQLFLVATLKGFPFKWETGADKLAIYSIGTGTSTKKYDYGKMYILECQTYISWAEN